MGFIPKIFWNSLKSSVDQPIWDKDNYNAKGYKYHRSV